MNFSTYVLCPRCERNYVLAKERYCPSCKAERSIVGRPCVRRADAVRRENESDWERLKRHAGNLPWQRISSLREKLDCRKGYEILIFHSGGSGCVWSIRNRRGKEVVRGNRVRDVDTAKLHAVRKVAKLLGVKRYRMVARRRREE